MNDNFEEYQDLIQLMRAAPKLNASEGFTEKFMNRLAEPHLGFWNLLKRAMSDSGQVTVEGFRNQRLNGQAPCFHFLIAGLFFFFIGAILLTSLFYAPSIKGFVLAQAILFLITAVSLAVAGLILAVRLPGAAHWAKRAVMIYGALIVANAFLIQETVKTTLGGLFGLSFGATGILMGIVFMSALRGRTEEGARHEQGGSDAHA